MVKSLKNQKIGLSRQRLQAGRSIYSFILFNRAFAEDDPIITSCEAKNASGSRMKSAPVKNNISTITYYFHKKKSIQNTYL